jgi:hypothetical protein
VYEQWKPPQAIVQLNTPPKATTLPKAPNETKVRTASNPQVPPNAYVAAPKMAPVDLAPDPVGSDSESVVRTQIEECLRPFYKEAQDSFQKMLGRAPVDEATRERLAKELSEIQGKIRRIANDMYLVKQQQAAMGTTEKEMQDRSRSKTNSDIPTVSQGMQGGQPNKAPSHTLNNTPPSPLSPPLTPHSPIRYIGPILTDEEEEDLFDDVTLAIRRQKIIGFHEEAAVSDIIMAERLHLHKKEKRDKREVRPMLLRHQQDMEELQMAKEKERKEATDEERRRRRTVIAARLQDRELAEHNDPHHKHSKQQPGSNSSKQKPKESQTRAEHAVDTQTNGHGQTTNGTSEDRKPATGMQANRSRTIKPAGSHGLFSMDPVDRRGAANGTTGPQPGSSHSRMTPLTPTVLLPDIDDEDDVSVTSSTSADDDESLVSTPDDHKHVRFTPSVLADNSTDSYSRFSDTPAFRPGFLDYDGIGAYHALPSGSGSAKSMAGRGMTKQMKIARLGLEDKEEKKMAFWYPTGEAK